MLRMTQLHRCSILLRQDWENTACQRTFDRMIGLPDPLSNAQGFFTKVTEIPLAKD